MVVVMEVDHMEQQQEVMIWWCSWNRRDRCLYLTTVLWDRRKLFQKIRIWHMIKVWHLEMWQLKYGTRELSSLNQHKMKKKWQQKYTDYLNMLFKMRSRTTIIICWTWRSTSTKCQHFKETIKDSTASKYGWVYSILMRIQKTELEM